MRSNPLERTSLSSLTSISAAACLTRLRPATPAKSPEMTCPKDKESQGRTVLTNISLLRLQGCIPCVLSERVKLALVSCESSSHTLCRKKGLTERRLSFSARTTKLARWLHHHQIGSIYQKKSQAAVRKWHAQINSLIIY